MVTFDRSVRNPARLCALYGFVKRKGLETAERPHRESWIEIPAEWGMVPPEQVAVVATALARSTPVRSDVRPVEPSMIGGYGNYSTLDVVGWFRSQGLYIGHLEGNKHAVTCPWADEHTNPSPENGSDTIVFETDGGWPGFHCKHSHCDGRTIRDVMNLWGDADAFCKEVHTSKAA